MRTRAAVTGTAVFFVVAPVVVAGLVPWALTGYRSHDAPLVARIVGFALLAVSVPVLVAAFVRFVVEGRGTPAPVAPTENLVVGGLYRYVRNPMYVAVLAAIGGQAAVLWRPVLVIYGVLVALAVGSFVVGYEQPTLRRRYGRAYDEYCQHVPGWLPRLRPWSAQAREPDRSTPS
jgi:protein-S-isoprenylcysteine O-methyltransferase Ste14